LTTPRRARSFLLNKPTIFSAAATKGTAMTGDPGYDTLITALRQQQFHPAETFGEFVTYERKNDPLKVHVAPDGSFAAFDGNDEIIAEGKGAQDLFDVLVAKPVVSHAESQMTHRKTYARQRSYRAAT
jgi:hypothetical protein